MLLVRATPLIGIDAVAIDTETTGLDTRKARVIQIGAVRIVRGRVHEDDAFATFINSGEAIPPSSTAVHGIDDAAVAAAPGFGDAYGEFRGFVGESVLIGHSIGFDLAILSEECRRSATAFAPLPALDTALLAAAVNPNLPGTAIETIANWLGVEVVGRHTATGDALTAARLFVGLVPHLRKRGIRTFGEAEAACREIGRAMAAAGHAQPFDAASSAPWERPLARIDAFPFRHRNRDLMSKPARVIPRDRPLSEAIRIMTEARVSSLFVAPDEGGRADAIVTERDVMRAIARDAGDALSRPIGGIASSPLVSVEADDFVYRAIGRMSARGIRHLAVADAAGEVVGALSARDLLRFRSSTALSLGDEIDAAGDVHALAAVWAKVPAVAAGLLDENVSAREVAAVISREIGAMTRRAAALAELRLAESGAGPPPTSYALVVLGSAGRGESLLAPDQDNAVVFADTEDVGKADAWFATLGKHVADILDEAGIPYCKGGVMAVNPEWRRTVSAWRQTVHDWLSRSSPRDLLNVDIFFDLSPVGGDLPLAEALWRAAYEAGHGNAAFAKLLAEASAGFNPPLGLLGGFRTEQGRIDLKKGGLFPIVASARLLSIRYNVLARSTPERLAGLRDRQVGAASDLDRLIDVHGLLVDVILRQQIEDIGNGLPPSNAVDPGRLSRGRQSDLKDGLKSLKPIETMVRDILFSGGDA